MKASGTHKKILFCSSFIPPVNAGAGKNTYHFASFLARKSYNVTLLTLNRKGKLIKPPAVSNLSIRGILYLNHNIVFKVISLLIIIPNYFYYVLKNDIVFIIGGNIIGFEFIILFGKLLGKKVVFRSTMLKEDDAKTLIKNRSWGAIRKHILRTTSIYFSVNDSFTNIWKDYLPTHNNIFESVHGVDTKTFFRITGNEKKTLREKLNLPVDLPIIISIGYLIRRKGFREIFEILQNIQTPFYYIIIGDKEVHKDHYMIRYNKEMRELFKLGYEKLHGRINIMGPKANVDEYLKASDIFILTSRREGFPPNALMEAMACGLPCVVNEIQGINNQLTRKGENLIVNERIEETIKTINKLISDPRERFKYGNSAYHSIQSRGSFQFIWQLLSDLI